MYPLAAELQHWNTEMVAMTGSSKNILLYKQHELNVILVIELFIRKIWVTV